MLPVGAGERFRGSAGERSGARRPICYSTPNASRTFPGRSPKAPYPELTNSMPPATVGAGPFIDPPFARTLFVVTNSRFVSKLQITDPFVVEYARTAPSFDGEKTTPGMEVTAENCALLQARLGLPQIGAAGAAYHARAPVARVTA